MTAPLAVHEHPVSACPSCGRLADKALAESPLSVGDLVMCHGCGALCYFDAEFDMSLVEFRHVTRLPPALLLQLAEVQLPLLSGKSREVAESLIQRRLLPLILGATRPPRGEGEA